MSNIATRVEELRREKGWSKKELATRSHLHPQHLYKVLSGERRNLSVETIIALARAFRLTPNDIIGWDEVHHA